MTFIIIAGACVLTCIALIKGGETMTVDVAPVGSMMILAGLGLGVCAVFFAGAAVGQHF